MNRKRQVSAPRHAFTVNLPRLFDAFTHSHLDSLAPPPVSYRIVGNSSVAFDGSTSAITNMNILLYFAGELHHVMIYTPGAFRPTVS